MALTVTILKTFIHSTLLESFPDIEETVDGNVVKKDNATLTSAVMIANQNYNALTSSMPRSVVVRFDSLSYQVKVALIHIYNYVMQDNAILHALSLTNMSLSENQIFEHYLALRNAEQKEVDAMRKELLDEIDDADGDVKKLGVMLHHRFGYRASGRRLP